MELTLYERRPNHVPLLIIGYAKVEFIAIIPATPDPLQIGDPLTRNWPFPRAAACVETFGNEIRSLWCKFPWNQLKEKSDVQDVMLRQYIPRGKITEETKTKRQINKDTRLFNPRRWKLGRDIGQFARLIISLFTLIGLATDYLH